MIRPRVPDEWLRELWVSAPSLVVMAELTGYAVSTLRRKRRRLLLPRLLLQLDPVWLDGTGLREATYGTQKS